MTRFSFEVPLAHLNDFSTEQDYIFSLSKLYKIPVYQEWIERMHNEGKVIILDNSFNEDGYPTSAAELAEIYHTGIVDTVIAPDHLDWEIRQTLESANALHEHGVPKDAIIIVVKDDDWTGYYRSCGYSHFAVSFYRRFCSIEKLLTFKKHHFLGLVSMKEIELAKPPTCDTSIPIKLALMHKSIGEWEREGHPHIFTTDDFLNAKMTDEEIRLAKANILTLKRASNTIILGDLVRNPKYDSLQSILDMAYNQASRGKGKERHDPNELPFEEQTMARLNKTSDGWFSWGQACKKLEEIPQLPRGEARVHEALGAIVYLAGYILHEEEVEYGM